MNVEAINSLLPLLAIIPLIANVLLLIKIRNLRSQVTNSHIKTLTLLDFVRKDLSRKSSLKNKQAIVERTVNDSTAAVENIHQTISDAAFNVINNLSSTKKIKARNQKLRDLHDQTSSDVYKSVKEVNKQVGVITDALLSTRKFTRTTPSDSPQSKIHNLGEKITKQLPPTDKR